MKAKTVRRKNMKLIKIQGCLPKIVIQQIVSFSKKGGQCAARGLSPQSLFIKMRNIIDFKFFTV